MEQLHFTEEEHARFAKSGITAIVLFGSRAQGIARANSDYDIGVLTRADDMLDHSKHTELYDVVYEAVSTHMQHLTTIDIVFLSEAPSELKAHVMKYGVVLFESYPTAFADFKERTMRECADYEPHRELFHRATLERIA